MNDCYWTILVDLDHRAETVAVGRFASQHAARQAARNIDNRPGCTVTATTRLVTNLRHLETLTRSTR